MRESLSGNFSERIVRFIIIVIITIGIVYILPKEVIVIWSIILLFYYYRSKDEAFWLAFFLVTTDGFMGFLGTYSVAIRLFPGLPAIELAQFYVVLSILKSIQKKEYSFIFYKKYIIVLFCYVLFMIFWGQLMGFSGDLNVYFRVVKLTFPLLLFYSIPRLFHDINSYKRFFGFIFIVLILAFFTQIFTLITGLSPAGTIHITEEQLAEAGGVRIFINPAATLLGLFGALFFLSIKIKRNFNVFYLYILIISAFGMAYLSSGRGWTISFAIIIFLSLFFNQKINFRRILGFSVVLTMFILLGLANPKIQKQSDFTIKRLTTMKEFVAGDVTAGGTLERVSERSPRVMKKWAEQPIFGWGFSDEFFKFNDGHVGNQNILLFSGIVGFILLIGFLILFCYKLFIRNIKLSRTVFNKNAYLVFIYMFLGWFFLHSSGAQQFSYYGLPLQIIPQVVFFSFGALLYAKPSELSK